ncbi:oxidoreductase [Hymenobacter lutimineralis]|uniref:Oxidoreductase n=1 Tax=Hymenobacter lutimineralis TaxID=2606448 RepID=A0A5D6V3D1_9BACT|nr:MULTISPECIES: phospholipid scramblase-related protein [Hymenobacter]QIX61782.1 oxidoreductase [Hymenobacter sp. BT18]TYZ09329.1 oxidoreductase [Hymenobacter lutimineralis]
MLNRRTYFIREHVGHFKLTDTYDILDPEQNEHLGYATETTPKWIQYLRLLTKKRNTPISLVVRPLNDERPVLRLERGWTFLRSTVNVFDAQNSKIGYFKSKLFSLGGGFHVYTAADVRVAEVKGNWTGWDFTFVSATGQTIGTVTKKWAGLGKELFTTADNYMISLEDMGSMQAASAALLLAAGLAIDAVFNEQH